MINETFGRYVKVHEGPKDRVLESGCGARICVGTTASGIINTPIIRCGRRSWIQAVPTTGSDTGLGIGSDDTGRAPNQLVASLLRLLIRLEKSARQTSS